MGSRPRAQSPSRMLTKQDNDSWRACFATRTPPRSTDIKGEHVQTHISFSLWSKAFHRKSPRVSARQQTAALVLRRVSGGCCPVLLLLKTCCSSSFCGRAATSLGRFSASLKEYSERANLKELHEHLFKDGFLLVCFWMWSFPGFIWWSWSLSLMLGLSARWGSARGWVMFSLREHDHRDAAFQIPPCQTRGYPPCHAPF